MAAASPDDTYPSDIRIAELLLQHAHDYAIFVLDLNGRIVGWSQGAERVIGYTEAEALGQPFGMLFVASDRAAGEDVRELERAWRDGHAEDTRWHLRKSGDRFWANGVTTAIRDTVPPYLIKVIRDQTRARLADEQRLLLLNELNHRINNTLTTVQSLVDQTLRSEGVSDAIRDNLGERLVALATAHKVLVDYNWAWADLHALVARTLGPYEQAADPKLIADGPPVRLSPNQALSMSLVLHELMTNAVKHGAFSAPSGRIQLNWNISVDEEGARNMTFLWEESGGPTVVPPRRKGFGSRLLARSFAEHGDGTVQTEFAPHGLRCTIRLKLTAGVEAEMLDLARPSGVGPTL